jgi:hypothetical protein
MVLLHKEKIMEISIDGVARNLETDGLVTFKDLVTHLERNIIDKSRIITKICLNDEELEEEQEIGLGAFPISEILMMAIETEDTADLAAQALGDALEYLPTISSVLEESARLIREGDVRNGLVNISDAIQVIGAFVEVLEGLRGAFQIDFAKVKIDDDSNLLEKMGDLAKHSQAIFEASKKEDWVLLGDIAEYELSPLLYEWMAIIPELVKLIPVSEV